MALLDVGDVYPAKATIRDEQGNPADADQVVLTITRPDGVTRTSGIDFTLQHTPGTGVYAYNYATEQAGLHSYRWVATGDNAAAWGDVFNVEPATGGVFISTEEALGELRSTSIRGNPANVERVRQYVRVACSAVERDLMTVIAPRTVVDTFDGGQVELVLRSRPVLSVTSVTADGSPLGAGTYVAAPALGLVYGGSASDPRRFTAGVQGLVVTYRAGYLAPPWEARWVAARTVVKLWQRGQQLPHPALDAGGFADEALAAALTQTPGEILAGYRRLREPGGIA